MLSIILADATVVAFWRGRGAFAALAFFPVFFLKYFLQSFFWVENAVPLDIFTLGAAHGVLAFWAIRNVALNIRLKCSIVDFSFVIGAVVFLMVVDGVVGGAYWLRFYFEIAAARILVPIAFWFSVFRVEKEAKGQV